MNTPRGASIAVSGRDADRAASSGSSRARAPWPPVAPLSRQSFFASLHSASLASPCRFPKASTSLTLIHIRSRTRLCRSFPRIAQRVRRALRAPMATTSRLGRDRSSMHGIVTGTAGHKLEDRCVAGMGSKRVERGSFHRRLTSALARPRASSARRMGSKMTSSPRTHSTRYSGVGQAVPSRANNLHVCSGTCGPRRSMRRTETRPLMAFGELVSLRHRVEPPTPGLLATK